MWSFQCAASGWRRIAGIIVVAFKAVSRVGEALRARRSELALPADNFGDRADLAYLAITEPKAFSSLLGRVLPQDVRHDGEIKITEVVVDI